MHLLTLAGNARNQTAQAEESLAASSAKPSASKSEMRQARNELEILGVQRGQARLASSPSLSA
jgi:chromosome segregation protein